MILGLNYLCGNKIMNGIVSIQNVVDLYNETKQAKQAMVERALRDPSLAMLHIDEFIQVTGFELFDVVLPFKIMWNSFNHNIPIYVTDDLIRIFGYKGEMWEQRKQITRHVKNYKIPVIQLNNKAYAEFTSGNVARRESCEVDIDNLYPQIVSLQRTGRTKHMLIMPRELKRLLMIANTSNGRRVQDYLIRLDELFELYLLYQKTRETRLRDLTDQYFRDEKLRHEEEKRRHEQTMACFREEKERHDQTMICFKDAEKQRAEEKERHERESIEANERHAETMDILNDVNYQLNTVVEERAPRTSDTTKHESFVLARLNNPEDPVVKYYAVRNQVASIHTTLRRLKNKYPDMEVLVDIGYQPNSKNLFNLMKENLMVKDKKICVKANNVLLTNGYTEKELVADILLLDESKRDVDEMIDV
jgi:hypothetical protein